MLEIRYIRENKQEVIDRLLIRGRDYTAEIDRVIELDAKRKKLQKELDDLRHERKVLSKSYKNNIRR